MNIRILLVQDMRPSDDTVKTALESSGHHVVEQIHVEQEMLPCVERCSPDLLVLDVRIPDKHVLLEISAVNRICPLPVVLFSELDLQDLAEQAVESGVNAYVVDGFEPRRIAAIIKVAMARFTKEQGLKRELAETKQALDDRKTLDKAKGIIMKHRSCNEAEAYGVLRKQAMDRNLRIVDVANGVISATALLG